MRPVRLDAPVAVGGANLDGVAARGGVPLVDPLAPGVDGADLRRGGPPARRRRPRGPRRRSMPRCWAQATPATATARRPSLASGRGASMRDIVLIGASLGPAALDPVRRRRRRTWSARGRRATWSRTRSRTGRARPCAREAVLGRQRLAVHRDGEHRVAAVDERPRSACRSSTRRPTCDTIWSAPGGRPPRPAGRRAGTPSQRALPTYLPPTSFETQVSVMSRSIDRELEQLVEGELDLPVDHAVDAQAPASASTAGTTSAVSTR